MHISANLKSEAPVSLHHLRHMHTFALAHAHPDTLSSTDTRTHAGARARRHTAPLPPTHRLRLLQRLRVHELLQQGRVGEHAAHGGVGLHDLRGACNKGITLYTKCVVQSSYNKCNGSWSTLGTPLTSRYSAPQHHCHQQPLPQQLPPQPSLTLCALQGAAATAPAELLPAMHTHARAHTRPG